MIGILGTKYPKKWLGMHNIISVTNVEGCASCLVAPKQDDGSLARIPRSPVAGAPGFYGDIELMVFGPTTAERDIAVSVQ